MKKKKILVLCPSPFGTAATQRLKYEQYFPVFEQQGYKMVVSSFQTNRFWDIIYKKGNTLEKVFWTMVGYLRRTIDLFRIPFYDGVYISLWVTPLGPPLFERLVCLLNKHVVYDIDDMIHKGDAGNQRFIDKIKGKNKPLSLMKHANYIIVCTPDLEEFARKHNNNVVDISSTFDTDRFVPVKTYENKKPITLGWTGTHSTLKYLDLLAEPLKEVAKLREVELLIISNQEHAIEGINCKWIAWTSEHEIEDLHKMDIGLYPIKRDEWSLGKSGLKALTYMSIAIPAIATAWGATHRIIDDEKNGFLVITDQEWIERIVQLVDSVELRERMGKAGRKKVVDNFSIQANQDKYLKAFEMTY